MSEPVDPADDALKFDLQAWEAPEPPQTADELADVVIARLGGTEVGAAIPVDESAPTPRRRALLIAGVAAAVIAVTIGAWGLARNTQHAAPGEGFVRADKAQTLQLDSARAELDPGADVHWRRRGAVLTVEQRAGNATWRVGTEEKLVIDAGATVASVEATGASLRVEVQPMNAADARVIGATALTAAAVSMVTVVVYEGHVKVHGNQQTVIVEPGSTYKVMPPAPVATDQPVVGVGPIAASSGEIDVVVRAGESPTILDSSPPTAVKIDTRSACGTTSHVTWTRGSRDLVGIDAVTELDVGSYKYEVDCDGEAGKVTTGTITVRRDDLRSAVKTPPVDPSADFTGPVLMIPTDMVWGSQVDVSGMTVAGMALSIDDVEIPIDGTGRFMARVAVNGRSSVAVRAELAHSHVYYAVVRPAKPRVVTVAPPVVASLDAKSINDVVSALKPQIDACDDANPSHGVLQAKMTIAAAGNVTNVEITKSLGAIDACVKGVLAGAKFPASQQGITVTVPFTLTRDHTATCDADALKDKGTEYVNQGQNAAALVQFEASLRCKDDPMVVQLAFMSSCNAQNKAKAQQYFGQLDPARRGTLEQLCVRNHISLTAPAACDATKLKDKGMDYLNLGQHAAALAQFEASLRCKSDPYVVQLAFMSSCNSRNKAKAQTYYDQLNAAQRSKLKMMCIRNKIDLEEPSAIMPPPAPTAKCDADALKDKGMYAVNDGDHAKALGLFEASLQCTDDMYVRQLAFMAACNAQDKAKANVYYRQLKPEMASRLKIMCERNHVDLDDADATGKGYLVITSKPPAKIQIDGKDTGLTTPITGKNLPLDPGKHKVTFVIGGDRFTYSVVIKDGETQAMTKDLQ